MPKRSAEFWTQLQAAKRLVAQAEEVSDLLRDQFNQRTQADPDWVIEPSHTIDPSRPRTRKIAYWRDEKVMQVTFRDGDVYNYYEVNPAEAGTMKRVVSSGKQINRRFNAKPYGPAY